MSDENKEAKYIPTPAVFKQTERRIKIFEASLNIKDPKELSRNLGIPIRTVQMDLEAIARAKISYEIPNASQTLYNALLSTKHKKKGHRAWNKNNFKPTSERDRKIIELFKSGTSLSEIGRQVGISPSHMCRVIQRLSNDPKNEINYNARTRETGKWYIAIKHIKEVLLPYYESRGIKPSLRTAFYRLESIGLIVKRETDYNTLSQRTRDARLEEEDSSGELLYPKLPIDCFADETRDWLDNYNAEEPKEAEEPDDPDWYINSGIRYIKNYPKYYKWKGESGEVGGYWYGQPKYVEVWIEKFALKPAFEKFLEDRYVNIVVNKGYSSLTFLWHNCQRLLKKIDEFGEDNVHVIYFGDFDPSGTDIDDSIEFYFRKFGVPVKVLERVAVTPEQIEEYNIPTRPLKETDTRTNGFREEYGEDVEAADLDAFLSTDDEAFEKLVQQSVDDYYDQSIYDEMVEKYDVEYEPPPLEEKKSILREMYSKMKESFNGGWDAEYLKWIDNLTDDDTEEDSEDNDE